MMFLRDFSIWLLSAWKTEVKLLAFIKSGQFTGDDGSLEIERSRT